MALLFMDGFDKYGAANSNSTAVNALLTAGEWTTSAGSSTTIVTPLSSNGFALGIAGAQNVAKTLAASYSRLVGGFRFSSNLAIAGGISLLDTATAQASVTINTTGTVSVRNGNLAGTALGTSAASITANTTHYLEFDITFGNTAAYQVWMDGVSVLSGSGDTTATANNTANAILLGGQSGLSITFDDFYLFDTTGTTNNAPLLTSPRIETQFPSADGAVQFAVGAAILGNSVSGQGGAVNVAVNFFYVRPHTPTRNCTINSISYAASSSTVGANFRPIIYSDNAGVPGTLLSAGATVVGAAAGLTATMPLTTPQALVAGTQYWLGFMNDSSVTSAITSGYAGSGARSATVTFSSGAPGTAPVTTGGANSALVWGNVSSTGANYYEVSQNPPQGSLSYLFDATIGHEDLFAFSALSAPPSAIYAVAVKASLAKSDAGAKTASLRLKSGATDSAGTGGTALAPGTSFGWMTSLYERDPNGNIAWTKTALDAAQAGVKVET